MKVLIELLLERGLIFFFMAKVFETSPPWDIEPNLMLIIIRGAKTSTLASLVFVSVLSR